MLPPAFLTQMESHAPRSAVAPVSRPRSGGQYQDALKLKSGVLVWDLDRELPAGQRRVDPAELPDLSADGDAGEALRIVGRGGDG